MDVLVSPSKKKSNTSSLLKPLIINILKAHESEWDPASIMNYEFGPNLILKPKKYRHGFKRPNFFSTLDIELAQKFYPFSVGVQQILSVDKNGGMLRVTLRKGETKIIHL